MPPTVPLTVLSRDEWDDDPPPTDNYTHTTPGHIPAHLPPFETLRANRVRRAGWVCLEFGPPLLMRARPLMGGRAAPPPLGGLGRILAPDPLRGAGLPRPHVGGWSGD